MSSKELATEGLWKNADEYVDQAESVFRDSKNEISTTKLRNLMSLVSEMRNMERLNNGEELQPQTATKIAMMRVRLAYECGRDDAVKAFVQKAKLTEYLKKINGNRKKLEQFANYMEALVAFQRYYSADKNREGE